MTAESPRDVATPPSVWHRADLLVIAVAALLFVAGALLYGKLVAPSMVEFSRDGLRFERPTGFFPPVDVAEPRSSIAGLGALAPQDRAADRPRRSTRFHKMYKTPDGPLMALEVLVDRAPEYRGLGIVLQQARRERYGEYMWVAESGERDLDGVAWNRTRFVYATKATRDDAPQVATGIEYATVNDDRLYVVTVHGTDAEARRLESQILDTLSLRSRGR